MPLPEGVHRVKVGATFYYYWAPRRGADDAPDPVPLGKDSTDPQFWQRLRDLRGADPRLKEGSFAKLIANYKLSARFLTRRPRTQTHYGHVLDRIETAWGDLQVADLTVEGCYALRAEFEDTPVAANHLMSILRTLLKWGLQHGFGKTNPAREIEPIEIEDEQNAKPWPEDAWRFVISDPAASQCIRRAAYLGRACGQRRADLVKFGPHNRKEDGIAVKIGKLRDKLHVIPLTRAQLAEIDAWSEADGKDIAPWLISTIGRTMSGDALGAALDRYLETSDRLKGIKLNWHGLRAMACIDRKLAGAENRAIAASIRMSLTTVERYLKHIDELQLARGVRDRLEAFTNPT